jgi:hypothetical protein
MHTLKVFTLLIISSFLASFLGCGKGSDIPNVSDIPVSVSMVRFEKELFNLDTNKIEEALSTLEKKYPEFSEIYFRHVLGIRQTTQESSRLEKQMIKGFVSEGGIRQLYDTIQIIFADDDKLKKDFEQAFRFFKYYFPEQPLSGKVFTYLSEYSLGGFLFGDNSVAVGLDFYLGSEYPYTELFPGNPNFSAYLTRTFNQQHLVMKAMMMLVQDMNGQPSGSKLLDFMIHKGKEMYVLERLLPYEQDTVIFEYSKAQTDWVKENEQNIWSYLISENLLYSEDFGKFRKLIENSPNSPGMPAEAPGRTGSWLGMQIVKAYMKRFPETPLPELIALKDSQKILEVSRYKPPRQG